MGQSKTSVMCRCGESTARGEAALRRGWHVERARGRASTWVCPLCARDYIAERDAARAHEVAPLSTRGLAALSIMLLASLPVERG